MRKSRKYPIGAEYSQDGTHFRIWAPDHKKVELLYEQNNHPLQVKLTKEKNGYFSTFIPHLELGTLYRFRLDSQDVIPDPASRYQPLGLEGASSVVNPDFPWTDQKWAGIEIRNKVIYEMHIGTFTQEGTFHAATEKLEYLAELGISIIEIMPINEFPGHFGWGYDGVCQYAPTHLYGTPQHVKSFINQAHALGIGVILDVVYNHFGPEGNFFHKITKKYFNPNEHTEWGDAINFDDENSRAYFTENAKYWIEEYHFDGLRIDAVPWFYSKTKKHILEELSEVVHAASPQRKKIIIGECENQDVKILQPHDEGGYQFDALWNDDFHHTAIVRLKGKREAYYTDYLGTPQEFISALKYGFLYQGQYYSWQKHGRGKFDLTLPYASMVTYLESHDQIANTGNGKRIYQLCDYGNFKALSTLLILGPNTPMLFQGQEFGSTAPFYYFADHSEEMNDQIHKGRRQFLSQFPSLATKEAHKNLQKASDPLTFIKCKLDFSEKEKNPEHYALYKDLIHLRTHDPVFSGRDVKIDGAVLGTDAFLIRYFGGELGDRLIIMNFGANFAYYSVPEPLIVPGNDLQWEVMWSTESFAYGGEGMPSIKNIPFTLPGHSALVLKPVPKD